MPSSGKRFFSSAFLVLQFGVDDRKQRHHRNAELHALLGHRQQQVERQALHAGHRGHVLALVLAVQHEHGVDQVVGRQRVFAHQAAGEVVAAQAARAVGGEGGNGHGHAKNCA